MWGDGSDVPIGGCQATTLTPEYLQLQAISKWNGQLPQYLTPNTPLPFIGTTPTAPAR